MPYQLTEQKNYSGLFIVIFILIVLCSVYFIFIRSNKENFKNSYNLGVCSKQCCATQWNTPIDLTENSKITKNMIGKKYYTSNLTCNNGVTNTGCVCLDKKSKRLLGNRGFVKHLPTKNGLLNKDHKVSAFKIMEDNIPRPMNTFPPTTELLGSKTDTNIVVGKDESKFDKVDRYRTVESEKELSSKYNMPVNSNIISYDNQQVNNDIYSSISGNELSDIDKLIGEQIGENTQNKPVTRK